MKEIKEYLSLNLLYHRNKKGFSQQDLAERCEISTNYIGGIERGHNDPSLKVMCKIADALEIPVHLLLVNPKSTDVDLVNNYSDELKKELLKVVDEVKNHFT